ncbi:MAG: 50S ribosomal protein L22 [Calditrichaeota bacterium]|nr:MAG: 50S ribosomal protein L22 [Calditrichota bacterium]MBL1205019.1 50S ribosomal protein L22 [Calditrichota bacterium]NOG44849.1 50S ribosomal protein L22 [Calditrichota bacterium]
MQATARTKFVRMSPFKVRRVLELVKGKTVQQALDTLHFTRKDAASPIYKTIHTAFSNLANQEENERFDMQDVIVKTAFVDGGPSVKRFRPMSMGRAGKIRKRTSHITVIVEL